MKPRVSIEVDPCSSCIHKKVCGFQDAYDKYVGALIKKTSDMPVPDPVTTPEFVNVTVRCKYYETDKPVLRGYSERRGDVMPL